jgi:hypothetical protein
MGAERPAAVGDDAGSDGFDHVVGINTAALLWSSAATASSQASIGSSAGAVSASDSRARSGRGPSFAPRPACSAASIHDTASTGLPLRWRISPPSG